MRVDLSRFYELATEPWRNGRGVTRVLAVARSHAEGSPPTGGPAAHAREPRVRVSLATLEASGPFSSFAGKVRAFALVEGEVELVFDDGERAFVRAEGPALWFDGGRPVSARLVGSALALNVIADHDVAITLTREAELEGPAHAVVVAARAGARVGPHALGPRDAARVALERGERLVASASGAWVWVASWRPEPGLSLLGP
jgi:environmental stress-induced protein Ves